MAYKKFEIVIPCELVESSDISSNDSPKLIVNQHLTAQIKCERELADERVDVSHLSQISVN